MKDMISRKEAIDLFPDDDLEWDTNGGYIAPHLARRMICELPSAQPDSKELSSTHKALDTISRQAAIRVASGYCHPANIANELEKLPSVQPEIIYCKDCVKHNKGHGYYLDGTFIGIKDCCPLVEIRGIAQGHEFDYQYCAYAERRTDG